MRSLNRALWLWQVTKRVQRSSQNAPIPARIQDWAVRKGIRVKKSPGFQINVDQELAIALFDRVGITILILLAAVVTSWFLKR